MPLNVVDETIFHCTPFILCTESTVSERATGPDDKQEQTEVNRLTPNGRLTSATIDDRYVYDSLI